MTDSNARLRHSHRHGHTRLGEGVEYHDHEHSHVSRDAMRHVEPQVPVHQNNHHSKEELMSLFTRRDSGGPT